MPRRRAITQHKDGGSSSNGKIRKIAKPLIEVLAGIPTVVYGFFAALTVGPFFRTICGKYGRWR